MNTKEKEYLDAAAAIVSRQAEAMPGVGVPVDPDVAEHMGAFEDDSMSLADIQDGASLEEE
ncbi:MAG: hypothetical protein ACOX5Z_05680 [Desulfobulbus sp.]|jgi:hypothetical protein